MALEFEFEVIPGFNFAQAFADRFGLRFDQNRVELPDGFGTGFIQEVDLRNGIRLSQHHYELHQPLVLKRRTSSLTEALTIKFDGGRQAGGRAPGHWMPGGAGHEPLYSGHWNDAVELATSNLFAEVRLPTHQAIHFVVLSLTRQTLLTLLQVGKEDSTLEMTLATNPSFVLHERLTPEMGRIVQQLGQVKESTPLALLLHQTKAQELLYLLFAKLLTRPAYASIPVHQSDAEKMAEVQTFLLSNLRKMPSLTDLARRVGLSKTRLTQLFRQIYGASVHTYFQTARLEEAAHLLATHSVSETGYQLGFTNLSHFTRVFERHHHVKPKRFKDSLVLV